MNSGHFTRSFRVPHPRLEERWIATVHLSLLLAFERIRSTGYDLTNANEDSISHRLEEVFMNHLIPGNAPDLDLWFITNVTRESATSNHDESSLGRKPDLIFHLNRRELCRSHNRVLDCLYAECKPVDRGHPLDRHYCAVGKKTSGIERFVSGAYASAMEQGMMIAYVRDGFSITCHLMEAFSKTDLRGGLGNPSPLACVVPASGHSQGMHLSTHQRQFIQRDGNPASEIDIYHSWHTCD